MDNTFLKIKEQEKTFLCQTFSRFDVAFERGEGVFLFDTCGKKYIDFLGGIAVNVLGHNDAEVVNAVCEQAKKIMHSCNLFYIAEQSQYAENLLKESDFRRVFFSNSGAEANECALKAARKHFYNQNKNKFKLITAVNSFHGRTLATATLTGQPKYSKAYAPLLEGVSYVPFNDFYELKATVDNKTCAVMLEVIQGESGVFCADFDYIKKVEALCRENDILLIVDEVQTGMGRTGKFFAYEHFGINPDIVTLAKGIANGIPMGATLFSKKLEDVFSPGDHGSTFGGNPLACAAANAVLKKIKNENFLKNVKETGEYFFKRLSELGSKNIISVRGMGLMLGLQLDTKINAREIAQRLLDSGIIIGTAGNNTLRFVPPLTIEKEQIDILINNLKKLL